MGYLDQAVKIHPSNPMYLLMSYTPLIAKFLRNLAAKYRTISTTYAGCMRQVFRLNTLELTEVEELWCGSASKLVT